MTILQLLDNFLTNLPTAPPPASTPSNSITIWAALVNESVDELVLSLEVSVSLPSTPTPTPPFPGLVVDSVLLEVFNIEVSGAAIRLGS